MTKQLLLSRRWSNHKANNSQSGISIVETMLVIPILFLLAGGILHLALLAQAKSNLEYAALMAARVGASQPNFGFDVGGENLMENEVLKRMRASDSNNEAYELSCPSALAHVRIMRPNYDAFQDFGLPNIAPGSLAIPNDNLPYMNTDLGANSGISIQDANILHIRVFYLYDSQIPFLNHRWLRASVSHDGEPHWHNSSDDPLPGHQASCLPGLASSGVWISADAAVVMQTHALSNSITDPYISGSGVFLPPP